jgi:quercetin dioxygenase-like cupin family protein
MDPNGLAISASQAAASRRAGEHREGRAQQSQLRPDRSTGQRRPTRHPDDALTARHRAELRLPARATALSAFDDLGSIAPQQIWERIAARCVHGERLTLAIVELDPGAVAAEHSHENEQLGIVLQGTITFRVGDEERELGPGETWSIPSNTPHEATAGPEGCVVIDVFSPPRDDFRELPDLEHRAPSWPDG